MSVDVPTTQWQDPNREVEYTVGDSNTIIDPDGNNLVDPSSNQIIDTGVTADYMAATGWSEDDSE
jgi:hypothetical protein